MHVGGFAFRAISNRRRICAPFRAVIPGIAAVRRDWRRFRLALGGARSCGRPDRISKWPGGGGTLVGGEIKAIGSIASPDKTDSPRAPVGNLGWALGRRNDTPPQD
jgi:hypothetical protein